MNLPHKNAKIELMRFVFSILVILYHCHRTLGLKEWTIMTHRFPAMGGGRLCVEFFFLTAGYLMAGSIQKSLSMEKDGVQSDISNGLMALQFVWKKYKKIFPYHVICFAALFLLRIYSRDYIHRPWAIPRFIWDSLPEFFLLQKFGFPTTDVNIVEWYISAMLIAMLLIYPIARRFYFTFVYVYAPVLALFLLGAMKHKLGTFTDQDLWFYVADAGLFRAIAQISLGICLFEMAGFLSQRRLSKQTRIALTAAEILCFISVIFFVMFGSSSGSEILIVILMSILILLAFSGQTFFEKSLEKPWIFFLGRLSLCIYLCQLLPLNIVRLWITAPPVGVKCLIVILLSIIIGYVVQVLGDMLPFAT